MTVRQAGAADIEVLVALIREFAEFEGDPLTQDPDRDEFARGMAGPRPIVEALLAESESGEVVGFALFAPRFNPSSGRADILYMSDLFVRDAFRGRGFGRELVAALAQLARDRGCTRIDWSVFDTNVSAAAFYRALGATALDDRTAFRLEGDALAALES
jgi:GNAT superfamily N-acetyltransferase